ncbi:MAG TPA: Ig-like domain-containing protein, partial [Candidatus Cybelea sp.]|nr:Ig-like domain-containing protein [Candidatus Cybelea sp.]
IQMALTIGGNTALVQYDFTLDEDPVTHDDVISVAEGETIQIPFSQVLTNDFDAPGHTLTIGGFSEVSAYGGLVNTNLLKFIYAPPAGLTNQDRFAYIVEDGLGAESVGIVIINFIPQNILQLGTAHIGSMGANLTMAGIPGQTYEIQDSTDLVHWVNLSTVVANSMGLIQYLDTAAENNPQRFYRAVEQ